MSAGEYLSSQVDYAAKPHAARRRTRTNRELAAQVGELICRGLAVTAVADAVTTLNR